MADDKISIEKDLEALSTADVKEVARQVADALAARSGAPSKAEAEFRRDISNKSQSEFEALKRSLMPD